MFIQYVVNITLAVICPDLWKYRHMDTRYVTGYAFLQFFVENGARFWKKKFAVADPDVQIRGRPGHL